MPGAAGALMLPQHQPRTCTKACSSHAADPVQPTEAVSTQHAPGQSKASQEPSASSISSADSKAAPSTNHVAGSSGGACVKMLAGSKSVTAGSGFAATASAAFVAAKLGLGDQLESAVAKTPGLACLRDAEGRCCLHYAAGYGHEECVDLLLTKGGPEVVRARDNRGDLALHMAAQQGHPMCTYNLAKACTASCMAKNKAGHSPIDVAAAAERGEVLNAMLLACSGDGNSAVAVAAMRLLLAAGAVPDTWAPNGSSALTLAASANGVSALQVLLEGGATIELQDALGRSALMFAAGSDATAACNVLLEAHASLSARDRRGRAALDYAPAGSESAKLLQKRLDELESVASQLQQQLLQEGTETAAKPKAAKTPAATATAAAGAASTTAAATAAAAAADGSADTANSSASKKKKKKKGGKGPAGASAAAAAADADAECSGKGSSRNAAAAADTKDEAGATAGSKAFGARSFAAAVGPAALEATPAVPSCPDSTPASAVAADADTAVDVSGQQQQREGVAATATAAAAAQEEEWQVVAPKSKHKPGPPCGHQTPRGFRGHAGSSGGSSGGLHQQVLLSAAGMAAAAAGSIGGKHAAAAAARHRRQGSAHSICSTMSFASCDSSSCSAGSSIGCAGGSIASAGANRPAGKAWGVAQQRPGDAPAGRQAAQERPPQQQQQQQGASAADSSAAAAGAQNPKGFKAALLKAGQDASASGTATPTGGAAPAAPGAAFAVALQAVQQAGGTKAQQPCDASTAADSNAAQSSQQEAPAMAGVVKDLPVGSTAASAGVDDCKGCDVGRAAAAADDGYSSPALAVQPQQQQEQDTEKEQQQQLQRMAAELLQARADVAAAQQQLRQQVTAYQQQLATILEDAAAHEATAVQAAVEAAVVETLQSPLLLQVLSTGVQQAVLKERTGMQVKLLQYGMPAAAVLHILTQQQQPPPPPAAGASARGPGGASAAAAAGSMHEDASADTEASETAAAADGSCANAHAAAAATVPSCAPLMAQMLSALASNVLAASAGGGAAATAQQQQHMQQVMFLQRLRQQQQQGPRHAAVPELNLDIRSEYYGGGSAFVATAKQQQQDHRESAAEAILKLHTDRSSCDSHDELPAPTGGQRRSSSGCSTMSALDDAPVTDVAAAVGSFYGTIGCGGGVNSSCSPHSSSGCSSAFGPAANVSSPAGGSLWGDASLVRSPALGTSPFLGPCALPLHGSNFNSSSYPGTFHSIPRTSPLGFASGCSAASAAARTQWGFQQPRQQGGFACGVGAKQGHVGDGRSSMDSSRLVDLLPDEL